MNTRCVEDSRCAAGNSPKLWDTFAEPLCPNIYFAGEHTIFHGHGTLHGAYASGSPLHFFFRILWGQGYSSRSPLHFFLCVLWGQGYTSGSPLHFFLCLLWERGYTSGSPFLFFLCILWEQGYT